MAHFDNVDSEILKKYCLLIRYILSFNFLSTSQMFKIKNEKVGCHISQSNVLITADVDQDFLDVERLDGTVYTWDCYVQCCSYCC